MITLCALSFRVRVVHWQRSDPGFRLRPGRILRRHWRIAVLGRRDLLGPAETKRAWGSIYPSSRRQTIYIYMSICIYVYVTFTQSSNRIFRYITGVLGRVRKHGASGYPQSPGILTFRAASLALCHVAMGVANQNSRLRSLVRIRTKSLQEILLMDKILHDLKDSKLWELWYIPYNG